MNDKEIIKRIVNYIDENNLSLPKIAEVSGINYSNLWKILNVRKSISVSVYIALCKAFKEPLTKFLD